MRFSVTFDFKWHCVWYRMEVLNELLVLIFFAVNMCDYYKLHIFVI